MNTRKLISLFCAAALSVSSFAGLSISVSAETQDLLVISDFETSDIGTVGGSDTGVWNYANSKQLVTVEEDGYGTYLQSTITAGEGSTYDTTYTLASPITETNYVLEFDTSIHVSNGMGRYARMNQIAFTSSSAATDTRSYENSSGGTDTGAVYGTGIAASLNSRYGLDGLLVNDIDNGTVSTTTIDVDDDEWVRVQAVVDTSANTAVITVINAAGTKIVDGATYTADADSIDAIHLIPGRGDVSVTGAGIVCLDNVHIYTGDAETLTTTGLRGTVTYEYEDVPPSGTAPEGYGLVASDSFNSATTSDSSQTGRLVFAGDGTSGVEYDTVALTTGDSSTAYGESNWYLLYNADTDPTEGEKYIQANSGTGSSAGRGPKLAFNYDDVAERETVVVQFATRLHATDDYPAELIFTGDTATGNHGVASPLAIITTNANADSEVYVVDNALTKNGDNVIQVDDNEWILVTIEAYRPNTKTTGAKITVTTDPDDEDSAKTTYIFGSEDEYADIKDYTKSGVNNLPYISFKSGNSTEFYGEGSGSGTSNDIDNVAIYSSNVDDDDDTSVEQHDVTISYDSATKQATITPDESETEDFDAVLIHAAYDSLGLSGVTTYDVTVDAEGGVVVTMDDDDTVYTGDKLMVWDSVEGMVPYCDVYTVTDGAAQVVKYTITDATAADANGSITVAGSAQEDDTVTITVTPDSGYELDTLTVVDADKKEVTTTAGDNNTYTFSMPASNVTVTATFKTTTGGTTTAYTVSGTVDAGVKSVTLVNTTDETKTYEGTIKDTTVTFSDVADGTYTIKAEANDDYEVDTITVGGTDATTVTVNGANVDTLAITTKAAVKTFTVSGTVDAGVKSVTLTEVVTEGTAATYTAAIADGTATFSGVPAGTYTVSATYGDDYKAVTVTYTTEGATSITVSDADVTSAFTVTTTAKVSSAVTVADAENGTVTIKSGSTTLDATALASVVEGTELTVSTVPNGGYELSKIEVTPTTVNSETTIDVDENGTFEMPAEAVTVTVTFTERTYSDGELMAATYISRYGTDDTEGAVTLDANSNYSTTGEILVGNPGNYARVGLMKFNATVDEEDAAPIYSATLKLTQKEIDSRLDNGFNVSSVTGDYDASTITFVDVYGTDCIADASKAAIQDDSPISAFTEIIQIGKNPANTSGENLASNEDGVEYSIDVTDYVKSVKEAEGTVYSLAMDKSRRGMTFYGYSSDHEPVLEITRGVNTTFTVVSASNEETKVAGAAIVVKSGDDTVATATTGDDGTATVVLLPSTEYTYTVTSADYAIKSDTLTTGTEAGTEDVALSDNVVTSVVITAPESTVVSASSPIQYSAVVKDYDGREMANETVTWSIVEETEYVSVSEDGEVSVSDGVTAGTYTVKATSSTNAEVYDTSEFTVKVADPATVTVEYVDEEGNTLQTSSTITGLYVGDEYTLSDDTYFTDITKSDNDAGTFAIYTYNSEKSDALIISELTESNTIKLVFSTNGSNYYIYETFASTTGTWGFDIYSGNRGSATGADVTDGELKITTNGYYAGDNDGASRYKELSYSGKIAISFDARNDGSSSGKGASIILADGTMPTASGSTVNVEDKNIIAQIDLAYSSALTVNNVTEMSSYDNTSHNFKFIIDFDNSTIDAYYDGVQIDLNSDDEGSMTGTITATSLSFIQVKHISSSTNTYFDNFIIEKLDSDSADDVEDGE